MNKNILILSLLLTTFAKAQGLVGNGGNSVNFLSYLGSYNMKVPSSPQSFKFTPYIADHRSYARCEHFFHSAKEAWDNIIQLNILRLSVEGLEQLQNPKIEGDIKIFWEAFLAEDIEYLCRGNYFKEAEIAHENGHKYLAVNSRFPVKIYFDYKLLHVNQILACKFSFRFLSSYEQCVAAFNQAIALHEVLGISHPNLENSSTFYISSMYYDYKARRHKTDMKISGVTQKWMTPED